MHLLHILYEDTWNILESLGTRILGCKAQDLPAPHFAYDYLKDILLAKYPIVECLKDTSITTFFQYLRAAQANAIEIVTDLFILEILRVLGFQKLGDPNEELSEIT